MVYYNTKKLSKQSDPIYQLSILDKMTRKLEGHIDQPYFRSELSSSLSIFIGKGGVAAAL